MKVSLRGFDIDDSEFLSDSVMFSEFDFFDLTSRRYCVGLRASIFISSEKLTRLPICLFELHDLILGEINSTTFTLKLFLDLCLVC